MESCEQQARNILEAMSSANEWTDPQRLTSGDVVELANLIAENRRLRAKIERLQVAINQLAVTAIHELANLIAENRRLRAIQDAAWNYVHAVELERSPDVALSQFLKVLHTAANAAGGTG